MRIPPRDWLTMLHAAGVTVVVEALIRWVPLPRLSALLGVRVDLTPAREEREQVSIGELPSDARRQLRCTSRIVDAWPLSKGPCLRRSLVAGHLLRRHHPAVRLGVAGSGDDIHAHAWLEIDGHPLEAVDGFTPFEHNPAGTRR
jgi:hypothetical protein